MIHQANLPISQPIVFGNGQASDFWLHAMDHHVRQTMPIDEHTLRTLLQLWLRKIAQQAAPNADDTLIPLAFREAHRRITTDYTQKLSLDELAAQVHLSPRYFCTRFKRYYGITPINLAIALRLTHARELLADVNLSITQIAMQTGFTDVYYFSRLFKQQSQQTPSQYRHSLSKQAGDTPGAGAP
jgi:transcriptional regulator GlxA family with amidase domain